MARLSTLCPDALDRRARRRIAIPAFIHFASFALFALFTFFISVTALTPQALAQSPPLNFRGAADYSAANQGEAVVVMQNGIVVFEEYQNGYNRTTPHLLASGSKSFSCAIAVKAQEEKLINLDEPVANVVPTWRLNSPNPAPQVNWKSLITARHLLSLASGLTAEGESGVLNPTVDTYQQALTTRSVYPPNFGAFYGNNTFAAFAAYFQLKTGGVFNADSSITGGTDPFRYLEQKVLAPLGITSGSVTRDPRGQPHLAGGMFMTARDWLRYGQMVMQGGTWMGERILDENLLRECMTHNNPAVASYGLTWWLNRAPGATLNVAIDYIPPPISDSGGNAFAPDAPNDSYMAAGALNQRLYIIPSLSLVVARFATGGVWSENEFLKRLLNGQKPNVPAVNYQDLWWAGPAENGWGMSLTQKGEAMFGALYVYDAQGKPQWLVLPGGTWNATFDTFTASLYRPTGSPFTNYDRARFVPGVPVGTASIKFRDGGTGTISYVIDGVAGTKTITRQYFAEGRPTNNFTDLWWGGPTQNGWGLSITQQTNQLFAVWYTYGTDGKVTWMVMPGGGFISSQRFVGKLYRTQGSPWLGAAYDPSRLTVTEVGQLDIRFNGNDNASMQYTVDGVTGTNAITRQPF